MGFESDGGLKKGKEEGERGEFRAERSEKGEVNEPLKLRM